MAACVDVDRAKSCAHKVRQLSRSRMEPLQTRSDLLIGRVQKEGGSRQIHIIFDHRNDAIALETFTDKDLPAVDPYYFEQH